jgi:hypothetical protein
MPNNQFNFILKVLYPYPRPYRFKGFLLLCAFLYLLLRLEGVSSQALAKPVALADSSPLQPLKVHLQVKYPDCSNIKVLKTQINAEVTGGAPPYNFLWSNCSKKYYLEDVDTGNYTLTVTDALGSRATAKITLSPLEPLKVVVIKKNASARAGGAVQLDISGGLKPYTIKWANGKTAAHISGLSPGRYLYEISDARGCLFRDWALIELEDVFTVKVQIKDVSCKGGSDGAINLTVTGGYPPYTYEWSNGAKTKDLTNIPAGSYTVIIRDSVGFEKKATYIVNEPKTGIAITIVPNSGGCNPTDLGAVVNVGGGTPPFSYKWSNGLTTKTISGVGPGNYQVTVTDATGCSTSASVNLIAPPAMTATIETTPITCFGLNNGKLDLKVTGGTPPFTYQWSNGATMEDLFNVPAGSYKVTVTDARNCIASASAVLEQPIELQLEATAVNPSCFDFNDGKIQVTPKGGKPPYRYQWANGSVSKDLQGLKAGQYSLTLTDANGCTLSRSFTLSQPPAFKLEVSKTDPLCAGSNNGSAIANVQGGAPPFRYQWSSGQNTPEVTRLSPGQYAVTVYDANGCKTSASVTLTDPPQLVAQPLTTAVSCAERQNGRIEINASGGKPPYTYQWNNGKQGRVLTGLSPGNYECTVTDAYGCRVTVNVNLKGNTPIQITLKTKNPTCANFSDGAIIATVTGGTSLFNYTWSNGAKEKDIKELRAGNYSLTVQDANGCAATASASLTEPPPLAISHTQQDILCSGANTGIITLKVAGGAPPYSYKWSNGAASSEINNLAAGLYTVNVTDVNGCFAKHEVTLKQAPPLILSLKATPVSCAGAANGNITGEVKNGTAPFYWSFSGPKSGAPMSAGNLWLENLPAGEYKITVTDANKCAQTQTVIVASAPGGEIKIQLAVKDAFCGPNEGEIVATVQGGVPPYVFNWSNGKVGEKITNLSAGTYSLTVTDSRKCTAQEKATVKQSAPLALTITATPPTCSNLENGKLEATVTGGTPPYSYLWASGQATPKQENLGGGNYTLTVTDAKGCAVTQKATLVSPPALKANIKEIPPSCTNTNDGRLEVQASGGTPPFAYVWSTGANVPVLNDIRAGEYTVTVTDSKKCSITLKTTLTAPPPINLELEAQNPPCAEKKEGRIVLKLSGGSAPFRFTWSNGAITQNIDKLGPGPYSVTVLDNKGCSASAQTTLSAPPALQVKLQVKNPTCASLGEITATAQGGVPPYAYLWSHGATTKDITNLQSGNYTLTVTDANQCQTSAKAEILSVPQIVLSLVATPSRCANPNDSKIIAKIENAISPIAYSWSNGAKTQELIGVPAGAYTLTVTDSRGCQATASANLQAPPPLIVKISSQNPTCSSSKDGKLIPAISGGAAPYTYRWSNGAALAELIDLAEGVYSLTVTDKNGCVEKASATLSAPPPLLIQGVPQAPTCPDFTDGKIELKVSGGVPPYQYKWSDGKTEPILQGLSAGNYTVKVTDANGCVASANFTVPPPPVFSIKIEVMQPNCRTGAKDGKLTVIPTGGAPPYSQRWSTGATTKELQDLASGQYSVTVTDSRGCKANASASILPPEFPEVRVIGKDPSCADKKDGKITLNVTKGVAPYTYVWNSGATGASLENLGAGSYSVTVTDAKGCATKQEVVLQSPPPLRLTLEGVPPRCPDTRDGSIRSQISGGSPPYTYKWNNGSQEPELKNLAAGEYSLLVTDSKQCAASAQASLQLPSPILVTIETQLPKCGAADAAASLQAKVSGGKPPFSYAWSTGQKTETLQNVKAGTYTLVVTDAAGCANSASANLIFPEPLAVKLTPRSPLCAEGQGKAKGSCKATVTGGQAPYVYNWSNGKNQAEAFDLAPGEYALTVIDANGCAATEKVKISETPPIQINISSTEAGCGAGKGAGITVQINNGTPPYLYKWSNGASGPELKDAPPGIYTLTITDANNCQVSASVEVKAPKPLVLSLQTKAPVCADGADGEIRAIVEGGQEPFTYNWSTGVKDQPFLTGLKEGVYTLEVIDKKGCKAQKEVTLKSGEKIQIQLNAAPQSCAGRNDGKVEAFVKGGAPPYAYRWSNGREEAKLEALAPGEYSVKVTDANGCVAEAKTQVIPAAPFSVKLRASDWVCAPGTHTLSSSLSPILSGGQPPFSYTWSDKETAPEKKVTASGEYAVTVTDKNGCTATDKINMTAPLPLTVVLKVAQPGCNPEESGAAEVEVTGGKPPYTYAWSNGKEGQVLKNIPPGELLVTVTDKAGCLAKASATIVAVNQLVLIPQIQAAPCAGQKQGSSIGVIVKGGVEPYEYAWSNGATTPTLKDIEPGVYNVTVTDAKGCQAQSSLSLPAPAAFSATAVTKNPSCPDKNDGEIKINVQGGTPPYTYQWAHNPKEPALAGLAAGSYSVTVTDSKGCATQVKAALIAPPALALDFVNKQPSCGKKKDGSILAKATGGTPPYAYSWSNGVFSAQNENLEAGEYTLTLTDNNGCVLKKTVALSQPASVALTVIANSPKCPGQGAGSIQVSAIGGMQPYTYRWSNGATTPQLTGLSGGEYVVTVTDANGCSAQQKATIKIPEKIEIEFQAQRPLCAATKDGKIKATAKGGTPPFSYQWANGSKTEELLNIGGGSFSVTITDAAGCTAQATYTLNPPAALVVQLQTSPLCCGNDARIISAVSGGTPPYRYAWSNGATASELEGLGAGEFSLTATDANGCAATQKANIAPIKPPAIEIKGNATLCPGQTVELDAGGPFSAYKWSTGETTRTITIKEAGSYSVEVKIESCVCKLGPVAVKASQAPAKPSITQNQDTLIASPASAYQWFFNSIPINNSNTRRLKGDKAGQYAVRITDLYGCSATSDVFNYKPPLPENEIPAPEITIYPNPNNGQFRLFINGLKLAVTVTISDAKGNPVYSKRLEASPDFEEEVTLNDARPGTYILKVVSGSGRLLQETRVIVH